MDRAYSVLHVKSIDEEQRIFEGIATTPTPDRLGDVVEPLGMKYALPMPLLLYHDNTRPVGTVDFAKPTEKGIPFRASIPKVTEPGAVKDRVDEAWHSIKHKLVGAVSIGFRALADGVEHIKGGGLRFKATEWLELSLVTVPAQQDAKISLIRSIDTQQRAAVEHPGSVYLDRPVKIEKSESEKKAGVVYLCAQSPTLRGNDSGG